MADPVKTLVKKSVTGSDNTLPKAQVAFDAAMVTALAAAQTAAVTPAPTSAPTNVWTDAIEVVYDGTNYNLVSAVNYFIFV